ncbi:hypothetical protein MIN45_P0963 [Methylomarinovum tepidoasis]|uniref:Alkaline phytoceramidase n=1 Tax=Methylomarinovum tepidoasis TaxID=2840183 RepID=A0AAU9C602_9GAMM|nr:alkaline phytoceramidase [Methylomarinovum sp. IN45]BCX88594.1 hypothetical protein MIN45_P0963 [Methylomarinovum sp. IN45]
MTRWDVGILAGLTVLALGIAVWIGPVSQDPAYHHFADTRPCGPVPNCLDVLSNLAFLLAGAAGLRHLDRWPADLRPALGTFWWGVLLVAPGSAWYHWAPDDARLVWDRLPMSFAFMGLFAAVLIDRLRIGGRVLPVLAALGPASVGIWVLTGDLRSYGLVQFLPMAMTLVIVCRRPHGAIPQTALIWALGWYGLAKLAEWLDGGILRWTGLISGHTLKHLLAALATAKLWQPADVAAGRGQGRGRWSASKDAVDTSL